MAKFLFFLPRFHTNAVPWVRVLQTSGHSVEVHCMIRGRTENYALLAPQVYATSRWSRLLGASVDQDRRLFPEVAILWRAIRRFEADVVVVRGLTRWSMRMAAAMALLQGRRLVVYDQEAPDPGLSATWLRRAICRIVGIRHFTPKLDECAGTSLGGALQIPFGCAFSAECVEGLARRPLNWPPRILMVAKYRERKRHADLLAALGKLAPTHGFTLTLCGEVAGDADIDYCESLRSQAEHLGIGDRLEFRNNVPHDEMPGLYAGHDVFILPSSREPAAVSPMEAVWCGCVAYVAKSCGTRSYLPSASGFDFADGDVDDLARVIADAIRDPERLQRARDQCYQRLSALAGDQAVSRCFEKLLE